MKNVSIFISQTGWWGVWAVASCTCYPPEISAHPRTQTFKLKKKINLVQLMASLQNTVLNQLQLYSNEVSQQLA